MANQVGSHDIRRRLTRALAAVAVTVLFADRAGALTCAYEPFTLNEAYTLAEGIVVAQVLGCADDAARENGRCPDHRYHLETIEVLKTPEPWRSFSGAYQGADGITRCGQTFSLDQSYLLFFDESGAIISSAGGPLEGPYPQTREIQRKLAILRDYRDGRVADLADPWIFTDLGVSCGLTQRVAGHEISFVYPYAEPSGEYAYRIEFDDDGRPRRVNAAVDRMLSPEMTHEVDGPSYEPNSLIFRVRLSQYLETDRDTATVAVGDDAWGLQTQVFTLRRDGRELASQSSDLALGENARQIFDAMLAPTVVTIRKRRAPDAAGVTETPPTAETEYVVVETRTTQFAAEAEKLQQCVDGTRRASRPAIR